MSNAERIIKARAKEVLNQCLAATLVSQQLERIMERPLYVEQQSYLVKFARRDYLAANRKNPGGQEYEQFCMDRFKKYREAVGILRRKWTDALTSINTMLKEQRYEEIVWLDPIQPDFLQVEGVYLMKPVYDRYKAEGGDEVGVY